MISRLLVADSDASLCHIYRQFFSKHCYEVETALDGLECMTTLRWFQPDVLVLEWEIPWGGGHGVLARLREENPLLPIQVVLLTGDRSASELSHQLIPPVVACLEKPFHLSALLKAMHAGDNDLALS
jgi:DNA-binding response OmpR family regulator